MVPALRRRMVTDEPYRVAPELLGRPLAAPWKRALALLLDVTLVLAMTRSEASFAATCTGLAIMALGLWGGRGWKKALRGVLVAPVAAMVALLVYGLLEDPGAGPESAVAWSDFGEAMASGDAERQRRALERVQADALRDAGQLIPNLAEEPEQNLTRFRETLLRWEAAGEGERVRLETELVEEAATLVRKEERTRRQRLVDDNLELVRENEALRSVVEDPTLRFLFSAIVADLGFGFGWGALWFTVFPVWLGGRTPGKAVLGLRVVRLDGTPITPLRAYSRFGGYFAGLATGLVGFLQILWDPNREAIQDRLASTVVLDERARTPVGLRTKPVPDRLHHHQPP